MRKGQLLFSAVHFFNVIAIVCLGVVFLCLEYVPGAQSGAISFFSRAHAHFHYIGFLLLGLSGSLFLGLYAMNRAQYIEVVMGEEVSIGLDEGVVKETIEAFWAGRFPNLAPPLDVYFSKKKIRVITPMPEGEEKALKEVEKELGALLKKQLGYNRSFSLLLTVK
ncbi:MAG: hypothetical protein K940chlam2_00409 [Chlamydiae bacterium]|nr:hypothetical protein [Chlamydiota bacterium]